MGLKSVTQDQLRQCTCCFYVSLVCIHYGIEICYIDKLRQCTCYFYVSLEFIHICDHLCMFLLLNIKKLCRTICNSCCIPLLEFWSVELKFLGIRFMLKHTLVPVWDSTRSNHLLLPSQMVIILHSSLQPLPSRWTSTRGTRAMGYLGFPLNVRLAWTEKSWCQAPQMVLCISMIITLLSLPRKSRHLSRPA